MVHRHGRSHRRLVHVPQMRRVDDVCEREDDLANGRRDLRVQPAGLIVSDFVLAAPAWWWEQLNVLERIVLLLPSWTEYSSQGDHHYHSRALRPVADGKVAKLLCRNHRVRTLSPCNVHRGLVRYEIPQAVVRNDQELVQLR